MVFDMDITSSSKDRGLNDAFKIGECISNEKKLSPVWLKVSTSPWEISAKKICGYGRPIKSISISDQMPREFKRTEHLTRPADFSKEKRTTASRKPGQEAAHVLPGGLNLLSSEAPAHGRHFKKYRYQNQVIMEPQHTGRPNDRVRTKFDPPPSFRETSQPASQQAKSGATAALQKATPRVIAASPIAKKPSKPPPQQQPQRHGHGQSASQAGGNVVVINSSRAPSHSIDTSRANHGRSTARFASLARTSLQA